MIPPDSDRILALLRAELFTTRAVARGAGLCEQTIRDIRKNAHPPHRDTISKIEQWMRQIRSELP